MPYVMPTPGKDKSGTDFSTKMEKELEALLQALVTLGADLGKIA